MKGVKFVQNFVNRNPRNFEKLRLERMPSGYSFERYRMRLNARHRLEIKVDAHKTSATITHHLTGVMTSVSTEEPSVKNQLYAAADPASSYNIGLLLAQRCKMLGISNVHSIQKPGDAKSQRVNQLLVVIPHNHLNDANITWDSFVDKPSRETKLDELDLSLEPGKGVC
uniref:Ribosomal protein L18 n=1 Tax=Ditylenchus dipsaci TaxID=166011 RepID=A0A915CRA1_9BILA